MGQKGRREREREINIPEGGDQLKIKREGDDKGIKRQRVDWGKRERE